jgi:hypothetical protein
MATEEQLRRLTRTVYQQRDRFPAAYSWAEVCRIVSIQLLRSPVWGGALSVPRKEQFRKHLLALAEEYDERPLDDAIVAEFARHALHLLLSLSRRPRHPGAQLKQHGSEKLDTRDLAEAAVYAEYLSGQSDEDIVRRAVTRVWHEKRKRNKTGRLLRVGDGEPLRSMLAVPASGPVHLARNDLRHSMLKNENLVNVLKQSSVFHESRLRPVIGDELWMLGKICGYADRHHRTVLVEVTSSMAAQELHLRQNEYLRRLQRVPGFENLRGLKFKVRDRKSIPFLTKRRS